MKYRTYKNMIKATEMIMQKGYDHKTANELAIKIFDESIINKNGMSIEWYINKIITKEN